MKYAVLVGINYPGTSNELRGCVNDVLARKEILVKNFGFTDIAVMTDSQATTAKIKSILQAAKKVCTEKDLFYFMYSGHGAQIPDATEADGMAEIICPIDFNWEREHMITDDDFAAVLDGFKGQFVACFDSCHSGDGLRDFDVKSKFIPFPAHLPLMRPKVKPLVYADKTRKGILMAGCHSDQTSADANIGGKYCGAFSYCMNAALEAADYKITYFDLINQTAAILKQRGFNQVPELDCPDSMMDKYFLNQI